MLAKIESVALIGTEARPVQIEVFVGQGVPAFKIVGLAATSVKEAEQRTRGALEESSERWPPHTIVANLAPGALRKEGTHFDLAIALGIVAADKRLPVDSLTNLVAIGELGLDGSARPIRGVLAAAIACKGQRVRRLMCPRENAAEANLVDGIEVLPVSNLKEALAFLRGEGTLPFVETPVGHLVEPVQEDIAEVRGAEDARRALEIAAAGGHNLLLVGPPGGGKTMLAQRLPGILPMLSTAEAMDVTRIYSVAGLLGENASLIRQRPFRSPHHHVSVAGLVGGGAGIARPGEVSLAHHGVLFLDELGLYKRELLDTLRSPLEDGEVRIARSGGAVCYPCRFSLVAASNPCPCGFLGDGRKECSCSQLALQQHSRKLSGPIVDRFDMQVGVQRLTRDEILNGERGEDSNTVRERVEKARIIQEERYGQPGATNSSARVGLETLTATPEGRRFIEVAVDGAGLTGRGLARCWRVARTIADLEGSDGIKQDHLGEALVMKLKNFGDGEAV